MLSAMENKSPGIVIDFRWNSGGDDNLASCMASWFVDKPESVARWRSLSVPTRSVPEKEFP